MIVGNLRACIRYTGQQGGFSDIRKTNQAYICDHLQLQKQVQLSSKAQATKRAQEGYTYAQERGFDVAEQVAQNEAVGQFTNMGVGLGTMAGVGGAVGSVVGNAVNGAMNAAQPEQPAVQMDDMAAFKAKVEKLTVMKNAGLITDEEFNNMKAQLLSSIL